MASGLQSSLGLANQGLGLTKTIGGLTKNNVGGLVGPTSANGGDWAGNIAPALGVGTSIANLIQGNHSPNNVIQSAPGILKGVGTLTGSKLGGLLGPGIGQAGGSLAGDVLPGVGAVTGAYNLAKNNSRSSDILSGAGTGASIGSMVLPGIGTGIGAGIGALVGWGRHAFGGPDKIEQGGREAETGLTGQINQGATQAQKDEAAHAGWPDPNEALKHIVLRDQATASGLSPQDAEAQASKTQHSMWDAESNGAQAVNQAASPIQSLLMNRTATPGALPSRPAGSMITDAFSKGANG
jgi:hypothetical protein